MTQIADDDPREDQLDGAEASSIEPANGNGSVPADSRRATLIEAAQESWVSALTDLGGRNTLLYFKDRRSGTLDLAGADPAALEHFSRTGSIRLTRLFRDVDV